MLRQDVPPLFDEALIRSRITPDFIAEITRAHFEEEGADNVPDKKVLGFLGRPHKSEVTQTKIMEILGDLRDQGLLSPVPNGEEREIRQVKAWNAFLRGEDLDPFAQAMLMRCPLPFGLSAGMFAGGYQKILELRADAGLSVKRGLDDHTPLMISKDLIPVLAEAVVDGAALGGTGQLFNTGDMISCPKTGDFLHWDCESLLAPVLGNYATGEFLAIGPYHAPKPFRSLSVPLPSGVLIMADWFRIPGFNEGIPEQDENDPDINSHRGIDLAMQHYYEKAGLVKIQTTNCVPTVFKDGSAFRVGRFDEDALWEDDPDNEGEARRRSDMIAPEEVGRVCCDLWAVSFADREVLIDILLRGGEVLSAAGGKNEHDEDVSGYATTREEAAALIDAYAKDDYVTTLRFPENTTLTLYCGTGHGIKTFAKRFRSPDLSDVGIKDMFVLSETPLRVSADCEIGEEAWAYPDRLGDEDLAPTA